MENNGQDLSSRGHVVMGEWKKEVKKIKQCPQRQDSCLEQLRDLTMIANRLGFYDAADYIRGITESFPER